MESFSLKNGKYLFSLIGILLFAVILYNMNIPILIDIIRDLNVHFLIITAIICTITAFLKILKWKFVANIIYPQFTLKSAVISYMGGLALSMFTPAKAGEVIKIFYLDKTGTEYGKAISAVIADRLIDIFMLFISGICGIIALDIIFQVEIISPWFVLFLILCLSLITTILGHKTLLMRIINPFIRILPKKWHDTFINLLDNYFCGIDILISNKTKLIPVFIVGTTSWILPITYGYTLALAVGISIPLLFFVALIPIICIIELAPISISGIGTRDLAMIYLFGLMDINPETALIYSLLYLATYWIPGLVGMLLLVKYPVELPVSSKNEQND